MFSSRKSAAPAAAGGYNLTKSLRFRSSAGAYLNRTPASSGNRKTWTWSGWVKRGTLGVRGTLFHAYDGSADQRGEFYFDTSDRIVFYKGGVSGEGQITTVSVFRDPSAWYHVVIKADYSNGTSADRAIIYVNNVAQTVTVNATFANADGQINGNWAHSLGSQDTGQYFDGYMAEVNFVDGQALTPSSFGETSTSTGVWQPIRYTGTYGTNGFYLKFTDTASTSTLGTDFSGNSNTWTVNGISLTAGSTYDSMTDVPTLTSATAGNYCVINPLSIGSSVTISNGNLTFTNGSTDHRMIIGSMAVSSGKWYAEFTVTSIGGTYPQIGIVDITQWSADSQPGAKSRGWGYLSDGSVFNTNSSIDTGEATYTAGDVIGVAIDLTNNKVYFSKNGAFINSADPAAGTNGYSITSGYNYAFSMSSYDAGTDPVYNLNFGQRQFLSTPPTGFVALNTFNLPAPPSGIGTTAATLANEYFNVVTYTGNGTASARSITGVGFQPDWVWGKGRSVASQHNLFDAVRGSGKRLISNGTDAETLNASFGYLSSFDADGFSTSAGSTNNENWNETSATYVAWNWKASGSTTNITVGQYSTSPDVPSIASTVSANTTAGFSIVTYTGNGTSGATIGHGLGVAPAMIIVKRRNSTGAWPVQGGSFGPQNLVVYFLNTTAAYDYPATQYWNDTAPTSSVFSVGNDATVNASGGTYVAYLFAEIDGYSKTFRYTGNGSTDGPFIFTGFRPRFVLIKTINAAASWMIYDTARSPFNLSNKILSPNASDAEVSSNGIDMLSNGFKLKSVDSETNNSGTLYMYLAFAESPFKYANAR